MQYINVCVEFVLNKKQNIKEIVNNLTKKKLRFLIFLINRFNFVFMI